MLPEHANRRVLVTGGSGGIGRATSERFSRGGARVAVTSRSGEVDGFEVTVPLDLEDPASITSGVQAAIERLGGLDVLVANAVRWPTASSDRFEDLDVDEWRAVLRANIEGAFTLVQTAIPALRASGAGRLVLVSSGIAEEGHPVMPHYAAAKSALHGLARTLAWDAGRDGVLVNVAAVGFTRTPTNAERFGPALFERAGALTPQRRVSDAADVAALLCWLASPQNVSVTGEVVREGTSAARTPLVALND